MEHLPKYQELVEPILAFLRTQDKPSSNAEIDSAVVKALAIPPQLLELIHSGSRTEFQYRMAWARTKAKSMGKIHSPKRETWEYLEVQ